MGFYDDLYESCRTKAKYTVWAFSDLQQSRFENAKKCLNICMEDYHLLGTPAEMIWYLGDSTESANLPELYRMTEIQEEAFSSLGIPLCYATGNHDYDYAEFCYKNGIKEFRMPFYEMVQAHTGWFTTKSCDEIWFKIPFHDYEIYFICDHVAKDNSWCSTHNRIRYGKEAYPYGPEQFEVIRRDMEQCSKKIITASHCAFPGGNRPEDTHLNEWIQPLPLNVQLHLYGHAHIGEYLCPRERIFSRIQWVDWQDIPQVDLSSFENIRGSYCSSVLLQFYGDGSLGLFFRNHDAHRFESAFFPKVSSSEVPGLYEKRMDLIGKW